MTQNDQAAMNEQLTQLRLQSLSIDGDNRYKQDLIDAITGALLFGAQGSNPPPADHWLEQFYVIGREEREALARVEVERERWRNVAEWIETQRDAAQAQMADVLHILDQHRAWTGMGWEQLPVPVHAVEKIRSKLAQAEQQEAQGSQCCEPTVEEKAALQAGDCTPEELWGGSRPSCPKCIDQEAQGAQAVDERAVVCEVVRKAAKEFGEEADEDGLQRDAFGEFVHEEPKYLLRICQLYRAALDTQPAAGEPVYQWREDESERWWTTSKADFEWTQENRPHYQIRILWTAPPAAAHGDEAVRIDARLLELYQPPFRFDERGGYIWDAQNNMVADNHVDGDQAMRVRGWGRLSYRQDGEEVQDLMGQAVADALTARWEAAMRAQAGEGGEV